MTKKASNRYVALLRAVNLGAGRQVSMSDLRELLEGLGMTDVATYVQSGNVVFTTNQPDREVVAQLRRVPTEHPGRHRNGGSAGGRTGDRCCLAAETSPPFVGTSEGC
ncbi:MAG: DUF1697 domain-containing protein [Acidimicrobiia bacterium]